eukprot:COSAG05_NODE_600_length_8422_cov_35.108615_11_plen_97_part_00
MIDGWRRLPGPESGSVAVVGGGVQGWAAGGGLCRAVWGMSEACRRCLQPVVAQGLGRNGRTVWLGFRPHRMPVAGGSAYLVDYYLYLALARNPSSR